MVTNVLSATIHDGKLVDAIAWSLKVAGYINETFPGSNVQVRGGPHQLDSWIDVAKWNLLRDLPVKMRGAEDDKAETAKSFASL